MRTGATQSSPSANPAIYVIVGTDVYTSEGVVGGNGLLTRLYYDEQVWGGRYEIELDNSDETLTAKQYEGQDVRTYFGFTSITGSYLHKLKVEKQQFVSREGKLLLRLTCFDSLGKLSMFEGSVGGSLWNHPSQALAILDEIILPSGEQLPAALKTAINAQYNKTSWEIITAVIAATLGVNITKDDQDTLLTTQKPLVSANDARSVLIQALRNTKTYPRLKTDSFDIDFIAPDAYGSVYSYSVSNLFFNNTDERALTVPNKIVFHGIEAGSLIFTASPHGENAASIALLGAIIEHNDYDIINRGNSSTQADVNDKANARLAKLQLSLGTGTLLAPMHCSQEMFDKITIIDDRYTPSKTITGYVFRIIREYDRGIYRINITLGGVETGYTPQIGHEARLNPAPVSMPPVDSTFLIPQAVQGYHHDIHFIADDQDTVSWGAGTIKFYDGTTQAVSLGNTGNLTNTDLRYIYFDLDDVAPNVLKVTTDYLTAMTTKTGILCIAQKGSDATTFATVIPSYGKEPLITADIIHLTGLLDKLPNGTYGKILSTEISSGHIKLTSASVKNQAWYTQSGVIIDADTGIQIYGTDKALVTASTIQPISSFSDAGGGEVNANCAGAHSLVTGDYVLIVGTEIYKGYYQVTVIDVDTFKFTHAWGGTDTGTALKVQCSVDSSGRITAGGGVVRLDNDGISITDAAEIINYTLYSNTIGSGATVSGAYYLSKGNYYTARLYISTPAVEGLCRGELGLINSNNNEVATQIGEFTSLLSFPAKLTLTVYSGKKDGVTDPYLFWAVTNMGGGIESFLVFLTLSRFI